MTPAIRETSPSGMPSFPHTSSISRRIWTVSSSNPSVPWPFRTSLMLANLPQFLGNLTSSRPRNRNRPSKSAFSGRSSQSAYGMNSTTIFRFTESTRNKHVSIAYRLSGKSSEQRLSGLWFQTW
ncbi:hypothetical protein M3J09_010469 [Ascochyta lentis]